MNSLFSVDEVDSWLIAVVLLVSFLVTLISVLLISLAVWFGYRGIRFLHPQAKLPEHFKQVCVCACVPCIYIIQKDEMI